MLYVLIAEKGSEELFSVHCLSIIDDQETVSNCPNLYPSFKSHRRSLTTSSEASTPQQVPLVTHLDLI
ncbi:hypothetical protein SERLA73DRAFT_178624 [Serpula lacrymans var. lacrymans S7.3]|uniref:Uncharacterized protein n=2 Tax=Serpula lacrymans var. lacrymans TaxID=341189 RepID=F8PSA5_SERL3|nr:uncharacterized protein SERLADRAFT_463135 [Serpula lacrymans var. lacrymans S7.9]EGO00718.1 hypothetical protein SERLA73DRAFT_178624 [Serpula lacrymans var. lacrymans S7.3]EGO26265.1 hypothetical protein SERLADRAFT_463135 [Serpula lacrymans var. lacrymans S7.9]